MNGQAEDTYKNFVTGPGVTIYIALTDTGAIPLPTIPNF